MPGGSGGPPKLVRGVGQEPDYRFTLANECTFLAWIRTSRALRLGRPLPPSILPRVLGAGGMVIALAH